MKRGKKSFVRIECVYERARAPKDRERIVVEEGNIDDPLSEVENHNVIILFVASILPWVRLWCSRFFREYVQNMKLLITVFFLLLC